MRAFFGRREAEGGKTRRRRTILLTIWLVAHLSLRAEAVQPISLSVTPRTAQAPATIRVQVRIPLHAENVKYLLDLASETYYSGTEFPLAGLDDAPVFVRTYRSLPGGEYQVRAILVRKAAQYYQAGSAVTTFAVASP